MTTLTYRGRLPGVVCQAALPPAGEQPLRLDVAAFVGFAERGPLDTPVAVEDFSQYATIFGGDLQLARDGGRPVYAHLPDAVRAFFDNGGRRCYAVRVAGSGARPNQFMLPGLAALTAGESLQAVVAPAAWVGRWSDSMSIGTQLRSQPVPFQGGLTMPAEGAAQQVSLTVEMPAGHELVAGDLLRIHLDSARRHLLLLPVTSAFRMGPAAATTRGVLWTVAANPAQVQAYAVLPPGSSIPPVEVSRLDQNGWTLLSDNAMALTLVHDPTTGIHTLDLPPDDSITTGSLLRVTIDGGATLILPVDTTTLHQALDAPTGEQSLRVGSAAGLWMETLETLPPSTIAAVKQVDLLRFDLFIREGEDTLESWRNLRFNGRPEYWPDSLSGQPGATTFAGTSSLTSRSLRLAAPADAFSADTPCFLPLGMPAALTDDLFWGPLPDPEPAGKDGLDTFDPLAVFADARLRDTGVRDLTDQAEAILWQSGGNNRLAGMHSLLPVEEVAIIALPDLAHRPWPYAAAPVGVPEIPPPPVPEPPDLSRFQTCPPESTAHHPTPAEVVRLFYTAFRNEGDAAAATWLTQALRDQLPATPLAALLEVDRRPDSFDVDEPACHPEGVMAVSVRGVTHFQNSADVAHLFTVVDDGTDWRIDRIKALTAWATQTDSLRALTALPAVQPQEEYLPDDLLSVQQMLVTLCAARKDLVALLSLPDHFDLTDVLAWQERFTTSGSLAEGNALSYAALYHPWPQMPERVTPELAPLRSAPPDGAAGGLIAAREMQRGVWVAPANLSLAGVVSLGSSVGADDWPTLFDTQVNLLYQQPGRFTVMSAHTLSPDRQLVQLSVRRLLIYLRKLALRRGQRYVFETNNERFRRRVEAGFERTLENLAGRGALAAYQVVTGEGLNTPNDIDNGRFLIALKVAPTLPIEFITVVLLRSGEGLLQALEI